MQSYLDSGQSAWQVTQTLIFGYLSDYIRCASNVLLVKCLGSRGVTWVSRLGEGGFELILPDKRAWLKMPRPD